MSQRIGRYLWLATVVFFLDRITKGYALKNWCLEYTVTPFLSYVVTINRGISWGIMSSEKTAYFVGVTFLIGAVTLALVVTAYRRFNKGIPIYGEILVAAGSCSNILDRFLYGGVIDFILFHIRDYYYPVFNCADCFIVLGIGIMFYQLKNTHD